jgi:drug/metabolite transporter (DMT)-like permease
MNMNKKLYTIGALLIVYIFWGATYLAIRFAVQTIPPFLMAGTRFLVAGLAVYLYARLTGAARPRREHWLDAGLVGAMLLLGGNGLVSWAEQLVDSSIAALLIATVPLWMILMGMLGRGGRRPSPVVIGAIALGFVGIGILVQPAAPGAVRISPVGIGALLAGAFFWALGSLFSRRARLPEAPLLAVGMQMLVGGALLVLTAGLCGEWSRFAPGQVSALSLTGMGYLILFGSIVGYSAYIWLLKNADPTWVSTYAFVNPIVAVFLGWLLAHERLTARSVWATAVIILSVVVITVHKNLQAGAARRA